MAEYDRPKGDRRSYRRNNPAISGDVMGVNFGNHLLNRMHDITRKMGFKTVSEFIRYSIRKELDKQAELLYMPQIARVEK